MSVSSQEVRNPASDQSMAKNDDSSPETMLYDKSSSENSFLSVDDNDIIEFGPIKVKKRRKPAPTLATGRRSKYETLSPEEEQKRDVRRARNRAAAERVRISRLNVELQLQGQIDVLEIQEQTLLNEIEVFQEKKTQLQLELHMHEKVCPSTPLSNIQDHLMRTSISNIAHKVSTYQSIPESYFDDLFSDVSTSTQNQSNTCSNSISNLTTTDDNDIFFFDI